MKYTIAAIGLIAAVLLVWMAKTGKGGQDMALMVVAIVSVVFFATVPNVWNALYKRRIAPPTPAKTGVDDPNVVRVADPNRKPSLPEK